MGKIVKHKPLPKRTKLWLVVAGQNEIEGIAIVHAVDEDEALQKGHDLYDFNPQKEAEDAGVMDEDMTKLMEEFGVEEHAATLQVFDVAAVAEDGDWEFEEVDDA
jgi:hypothetical protein